MARRPRGLVVEIASIKDPLSPVLARARERGVRAFALHPMFGPGKSFYEPLTFVLAAQGDPAAEKTELAPLLSHPYTKLVAVPFPHHDRLMGWLLGLAHLSNILFGAAITHSGIEPDELHACASTTFTRQADDRARTCSRRTPTSTSTSSTSTRTGTRSTPRPARRSNRSSGMVEERDREGFRADLRRPPCGR